jgi:hypothetical protein
MRRHVVPPNAIEILLKQGALASPGRQLHHKQGRVLAPAARENCCLGPMGASNTSPKPEQTRSVDQVSGAGQVDPREPEFRKRESSATSDLLPITLPRQCRAGCGGRQLLIPKLLQNLPYLLSPAHERLHTSRVEVLTLLRFEVGEGLFEAPRMFVRPLADQGVEYV